jgi:membrane-associated protease RseP (regulator of RpoE activity)
VKQFEPYLKCWRSTSVNDREIVDAVVRTDHAGPSDELKDALEKWPGVYYWVHGDGLARIVLIRSVGKAVSERWLLHLALFALTFLTMLMAGAVLAGNSVDFGIFSSASFSENLTNLTNWLGNLIPGLVFASALMAILLIHELGHYFAARKYGIDASPPYFLPAPFWWTFIGTFGAFIRIRSPIVDRRQLMDVGASGPWAGFVVALICLGVGIVNSTVVQFGEPGQILAVGNVEITLGDSLIMVWLRGLLRPEGLIQLHPLAFAGWLGMFVTTLNLLPMGQLDGGHVLYAMIGEKQKVVGWVMWYALLAMGFQFKGWWIWAILTLALGRGGLAHPSVLDRFRPVPRSRIPMGWATVFLFIITFTPVPFPF